MGAVLDRTESIGGSVASKPDAPREQTFGPTADQEEFLFDTAGEILMSGTVGAGKSKIGCEKGYKLNIKYPGNRGLIVRKHFSDVQKSTIRETLLDNVIPQGHIVEHNKGEHFIKHLSGESDPRGDPVVSEIHYSGLDSGENSVDNLPKKVMSREFGWIFVDEGTELNESEWTALLTRLRYTGTRQNGFWYKVPITQIFTATNPAPPTHWMHGKFIAEGGEDGTSTYRMTLHDNPGLEPEYVDRLETQLSGIHYERLVEGKWKGAEGMIYDEYDPLQHLIHPSDLPGDWQWDPNASSKWAISDERTHWVVPPKDWQIYRSVDFGYTNPFVCQWWAHGPDDTLILFRELYKSEEIVEDLAEEIERLTPDGRSVTKTIADHDAEDRETLNRHGISTVAAKKSVGDGINSVKSRLQFDDRGKANLYMMEGARAHPPDSQLHRDEATLKTSDEISGYVWDENATEKGDDEPVKKDDHGMDAMRYMVYSIDGGIKLSQEEIDEWKSITEGF